jgi:hypothetical protein
MMKVNEPTDDCTTVAGEATIVQLVLMEQLQPLLVTHHSCFCEEASSNFQKQVHREVQYSPNVFHLSRKKSNI